MRAATIVIITAGGCLERAASPGKAVVCILIDAAAGVALGTRVVTVTDSRGFHRRWWRRARIGRILASLDGVRGLHGYTTFASGGTSHITCHSDVAFLSPATAPWVLHYPVINSIFGAISDCRNPMIQSCPTFPSKYTLWKLEGKVRAISFKESSPLARRNLCSTVTSQNSSHNFRSKRFCDQNARHSQKSLKAYLLKKFSPHRTTNKG